MMCFLLKYHVFAIHRKMIFSSISPCFLVVLPLWLADRARGCSLLTFWRLWALSIVRRALRGSDLGRLWAEFAKKGNIWFAYLLVLEE